MTGLIKDTTVFETFQVTVELTRDVPSISGYTVSLDVRTFIPELVEIMWVKKNGESWDFKRALVKTVGGKYHRTVFAEELSQTPWIRELVDELTPGGRP